MGQMGSAVFFFGELSEGDYLADTGTDGYRMDLR
jgi:hypothetical protein